MRYNVLANLKFFLVRPMSMLWRIVAALVRPVSGACEAADMRAERGAGSLPGNIGSDAN